MANIAMLQASPASWFCLMRYCFINKSPLWYYIVNVTILTIFNNASSSIHRTGKVTSYLLWFLHNLLLCFSVSVFEIVFVQIILNRVLLVGTKTSTYIGKPVVPNAAVHAVVEEQVVHWLEILLTWFSVHSYTLTWLVTHNLSFQGLNPKVMVFKYKKKKNYRRNIGHRQVLQFCFRLAITFRIDCMSTIVAILSKTMLVNISNMRLETSISS